MIGHFALGVLENGLLWCVLNSTLWKQNLMRHIKIFSDNERTKQQMLRANFKISN
jgi:hypothetical protein